jgi:fatty-acyl-CoA synthase
MDHDAVDQTSVIGLPDEKWGEIVLAVVQPAAGRTVDFKELDRHCRDRLANFKIPVLWCATDSFPMNAMGKIQKFELAAWVREGKLSPSSVR